VSHSEGDGTVQAWIDLLTEWQTAHAPRVDAIVARQARKLYKAIKRHGAWYGVRGVDAPEIETRPNVISWFDIEDPDGNEVPSAD
jgi:hypothetical protein